MGDALNGCADASFALKHARENRADRSTPSRHRCSSPRQCPVDSDPNRRRVLFDRLDDSHDLRLLISHLVGMVTSLATDGERFASWLIWTRSRMLNWADDKYRSATDREVAQRVFQFARSDVR